MGDDATSRWWTEARFGLFVHWSAASLAGVELSWPMMLPDRQALDPAITEAEYAALPARFDPARFDATELVAMAKEAGQRYIVFTAKHHDGFCMFDSAFTDYKITRTPFGRDVCRELAEACAAAGMPLGFYYSQPDMHHPGFRDTTRPVSETWQGDATRPEWFGYLDYMEAQLEELLTRYGDVAVVWFDGIYNQERYQPTRFHRWLRANWPDVLVNDRMGGNHLGNGVPGHGGALLAPEVWGDFTTPEQHVPDGLVPDGPWETCMTINNAWGYKPNDTAFRSTTELVVTLVDVVSKGGNLLLNVGPTDEGTVQPEFVDRLRGVGAWLRKHGDAIYGASRGPIAAQPWGRTTAKDMTAYLHVTDWPADDTLIVEGLSGRIAQVAVLATGRPLTFTQPSPGTLEIKLPVEARDPHVTVLRLRTA